MRRELRRQELERDVAPEPRIAAPIDDPHSSGPEKAKDFVAAKAGTRAERHAPSLAQRDRCLTERTGK